MKRLTIKNDEQNQYYLFASNDVSREDVYNKLGQIEDTEEELGIELLTLLKAIKNGVYLKRYGEIKFLDGEHMCIVYGFNKYCISWGYKGEHGVASGVLWLKQYGEKWALTREELEE